MKIASTLLSTCHSYHGGRLIKAPARRDGGTGLSGSAKWLGISIGGEGKKQKRKMCACFIPATSYTTFFHLTFCHFPTHPAHSTIAHTRPRARWIDFQTFGGTHDTDLSHTDHFFRGEKSWELSMCKSEPTVMEFLLLLFLHSLTVRMSSEFARLRNKSTAIFEKNRLWRASKHLKLQNFFKNSNQLRFLHENFFTKLGANGRHHRSRLKKWGFVFSLMVGFCLSCDFY